RHHPSAPGIGPDRQRGRPPHQSRRTPGRRLFAVAARRRQGEGDGAMKLFNIFMAGAIIGILIAMLILLPGLARAQDFDDLPPIPAFEEAPTVPGAGPPPPPDPRRAAPPTLHERPLGLVQKAWT